MMGAFSRKKKEKGSCFGIDEKELFEEVLM
jgi:hypothetical protein